MLLRLFWSRKFPYALKIFWVAKINLEQNLYFCVKNIWLELLIEKSNFIDININPHFILSKFWSYLWNIFHEQRILILRREIRCFSFRQSHMRHALKVPAKIVFVLIANIIYFTTTNNRCTTLILRLMIKTGTRYSSNFAEIYRNSIGERLTKIRKILDSKFFFVIS